MQIYLRIPKKSSTFAGFFEKKASVARQFSKAVLTIASLLPNARKDGRVVYCVGLENRSTETYRGFESLSFRKTLTWFAVQAAYPWLFPTITVVILDHYPDITLITPYSSFHHSIIPSFLH